MHVEQLAEFLSTVTAGPVTETSELAHKLRLAWTAFSGWDSHGMWPSKLEGRMEDVRWHPPILRFVIERHGAACLGSTRAELQHWEVDIEKKTAWVVKIGQRQLVPMTPRVSIKRIADDLAATLINGHDHPSFKRMDDGSVKVLAQVIFPTDSGYKMTIRGRRKKLRDYLAERLAEHGWVRTSYNVFRRTV